MKNERRLQVHISSSGYCSRRRAMRFIFDGQVTVNGQVVREPSYKIDAARDDVRVADRRIGHALRHYIILNKPCGFVSTRSDPFAAKTIYSLLPEELRILHPVGRLDKNTAGLLLLTNDGELTYHLTHPRFHIDKTYAVTVHGLLGAEDRRRLERGVMLDGRRTAAAKIGRLTQHKQQTAFHLTIHEGRKRQIRRMLAVLKHPVITLKRLSLGPVSLGAMKSGSYRPMSKQEVERLKSACGLNA